MEPIKTLNPLIDLDPVVYAAGFAADSEVRAFLKKQGVEEEKIHELMQAMDYQASALNNAKTHLEFVLNDCFPERKWYQAFLSGGGNFRKEVATIKPYKGNRDPNHKPKYFEEIREYLVNRWNARVVEGQEADDAIGIAQYSHPDKSTCIVSIDKDMKMIPGYHLNPGKHEFYYQTLDEADLFFWWQMMVGDSTDNIPGITGVGPKTADKILAELDNDPEKIEARVREMYDKQYGDDGPRALEEVATLLWIRRKEGQGPNV